MARLPIPGSDNGTWGDLLNEFLLVEHKDDGSLKKTARLGASHVVGTNSDSELIDVSLGSGLAFANGTLSANVLTGMIFPVSTYPVTAGNVFPNFHVGAGPNSKHDEGLGVAASIGSDSIWRLRFHLPLTLPTGTCKLRIVSLANATTGNAKLNPKWVSVGMGEDVSSATLNAEGTSTITWAAGDNDKYKQTKIVLNADTPMAGEVIAMDLVFEAASWTLAQVSTHIVSIIWE